MARLKIWIGFGGVLTFIASNAILKDASRKVVALVWSGGMMVSVTLCIVYHMLIYNNYLSPYRFLPLPEQSHWFFGHLKLGLNLRPGLIHLKWLEWNDDNTKSPFVRIFAPFKNERLFACSPAALQSVLMTNSYLFVKPENLRKSLGLLLGDGILVAEGDSHKRQRKLLNPSFAFGHIKALTPAFLTESLALANKFAGMIDTDTPAGNLSPSETIINVDDLIQAATLDIIFETGFGTKFNALENPDDELARAYRDAFLVGDITFLMILDFIISDAVGVPNLLPTTRNIKLRRAAKTINRFAKTLVREKQRALEQEKDSAQPSTAGKSILSILLGNGKVQWTEHEIVNNLMTFLAAGHETTSTAVSSALYELSKNPAVQSKLRSEILETVPDYASYRPGDASANPLLSLTFDKIEGMRYLGNFCREVLRFAPPVVATSRKSTEDIMVDGVLVKKDTMVVIPILAVNQLKSIWGEDADVFNPDRWDSLPAEAATPYSFLTFLQGPRSCIGRKFAEVEFKCLLIALVGMLEFDERSPGEEFKMEAIVTAKFVGGLPLKVKLAKAKSAD